ASRALVVVGLAAACSLAHSRQEWRHVLYFRGVPGANLAVVQARRETLVIRRKCEAINRPRRGFEGQEFQPAGHWPTLDGVGSTASRESDVILRKSNTARLVLGRECVLQDEMALVDLPKLRRNTSSTRGQCSTIMG